MGRRIDGVKGDGSAYMVPTTICPNCGSTMVSETKLIFLADEWEESRPVYEFDLADEIQGNLFVCVECGRESYVKETTLIHEDGYSQTYR